MFLFIFFYWVFCEFEFSRKINWRTRLRTVSADTKQAPHKKNLTQILLKNLIRCMNVDEARGVCKDRSRWRSVVTAYPRGKKTWNVFVCMLPLLKTVHGHGRSGLRHGLNWESRAHVACVLLVLNRGMNVVTTSSNIFFSS